MAGGQQSGRALTPKKQWGDIGEVGGGEGMGRQPMSCTALLWVLDSLGALWGSPLWAERAVLCEAERACSNLQSMHEARGTGSW